MGKSKLWLIEQWFLRLRSNIREHRLWLQEYENFLETATPEQLNQFLSDMRTMEEIEAQQKKEKAEGKLVDADVILDKISNILNVFLLVAGIYMISYGGIIVYASGINTEAAINLVVGIFALFNVGFDCWCNRQKCSIPLINITINDTKERNTYDGIELL